MPVFAATLNEGSKTKIIYDVVRDLKTALKPALYDELMENSFYYAPPYITLYGFMVQYKKWPLLFLTMMELESQKIQDMLHEYVQAQYPKDYPVKFDLLQSFLEKGKKKI